VINVKKLRILTHPNEALRKVCEPVDKVTGEVSSVISRMFQLMSQSNGMGLAAPQVGLPWQMFVMNSVYTGRMVAINPILSGSYGGLVVDKEGCLSLPGFRYSVSRPKIATLSGLDEKGQPFCRVGKDIVSRCWFHEWDHCQGILIIDKAIGLPEQARKRPAH
jgi:peptide deformylase